MSAGSASSERARSRNSGSEGPRTEGSVGVVMAASLTRGARRRRASTGWTVDARSHDALSHCANMTFQKRRQWVRVFISARRQGLGRLRLLLFALECAMQVGSGLPMLVALRVVPRVAARRARRERAVWHLSPLWAPRALGAIAVGIFFWALLAPPPQVFRVQPPPEWPPHEELSTDWLSRDGGTLAVPMPSKRLERQQAPPCAPAPSRQVEINGGCWFEVVESLPCGQLYEHHGRCYVPVREALKPPSSAAP
jgi:hypothetical protein